MFISYDPGEGEHHADVLALANELRRGGVDAWVDLYIMSPSEGWPRWREQQLREADFVIAVCTASYRRHFEDPCEGKARSPVEWEAHFVRQRLAETPSSRERLLPVLLRGSSRADVPQALRGLTEYALPSEFDRLYRRITGQPAITVPPLGELRRSLDNIGRLPLVFEGRDAELARIREVLTADEEAAKCAVLTGLGGVGKTRLALEYASRAKGQYEVRWRVRAAALTSLQGDLIELGQQLGVSRTGDDVEHAVGNVAAWLSTHTRWLLVIDNVEGPEVLRQLLPSLGPGHVIITSRAKAWRGTGEPIEVGRLDRAAAEQVLRARSGQPDDGCIEALARELGCFALALAKAGAYMESTGCSYASYLERVTFDGLRMVDDAKAELDDYEYTVARTWEVSLEAIRQQSPVAAAFLDWLAFLDPDGLPVRLLRDHPLGVPRPVAACVETAQAFDDAMAVLRRFSLVERLGSGEQERLVVHRLVQAVTRERMSPEVRRDSFRAVTRWVCDLFDYVPNKTPLGEVADGCVDQLMALSSLKDCEADAPDALIDALRRLGSYLTLRGAIDSARVVCQRALTLSDALSIERGSIEAVRRHRSASLNALILVEQRAGNLTAVRELCERSLELSESLTEQHPDSGRAHHDVSVVLHILGDMEVENGDLAKAHEYFQRGSDVLEALVDANPSHAPFRRDWAVFVAKAADTQMMRGHFATARSLFERSIEVLRRLETSHGLDPQVKRGFAVLRGKLGDIKKYTGDIRGALEELRAALSISRELLEGDPSNVQAMCDVCVASGRLGCLLHEAGDSDEARVLLECALAVAEQAVAADPTGVMPKEEISRTLDALAILEVNAENWRAARPLLLRSIVTRDRLLGRGPRIAPIEHNLAGSLGTLGRVAHRTSNLLGARSLLLRSIDGLDQLLGRDPNNAQMQVDLATTLGMLADVENDMGNRNDALVHYERCATVFGQVWTTEPSNGYAAFRLAVSYMRLGDIAIAMRDVDRRYSHYSQAKELLESMASRGQVEGYAERMRAIDHVNRVLAGTDPRPTTGPR